jgi:hypothetical protein
MRPSWTSIGMGAAFLVMLIGSKREWAPAWVSWSAWYFAMNLVAYHYVVGDELVRLANRNRNLRPLEADDLQIRLAKGFVILLYIILTIGLFIGMGRAVGWWGGV